MDVFVKIVQLLLSLSILVLFHEFGHFLFAKLFKTRVEKFYMFFNPWFSLFKFKKGETEYGIGWLPLGGYVKIAGMIDESIDTAQMRKPAQPWEFRSKPAWQRLLIMLGGVMVNVVLAFLIYIMVLYTWGETYLPAENVKYGVVCDPLFEKMGMQTGDIVVSLDSVKVERFSDILADMTLDHPQTVQVEREGKLISLDIPETFTADLLALSSKNNRVRLLVPRQLMDSTYVAEFADYSAAYDAGIRKGDKILAVNGRTFRFYDEFTDMLAANADSRVETKVLRGKDTLQFAFDLGNDGKFGIYFGSTERLELAFRKYSFGEAIPAGIAKGAQTISSYLKQLKLIFSPRVEAYKSVGGVMMMGSIFPGVWDWQIFWELTAFISIMLAVVNILPIPALDGGRLVFLIWEAITHKPVPPEKEGMVHFIGLVFFMVLMVFLLFNDLVNIFG